MVTAEASFKDLSLDSLDVVEVVMAIEEEFALEIPDSEVRRCRENETHGKGKYKINPGARVFLLLLLPHSGVSV